MRRAPILLLALLALPAGVLAQSLGEVAAQEKARREKAKQTGKKQRPAKTYTDDDLLPGASRDKTEAPPPEPYIPSTPSSSGTEGSEGQGEEASGPRAQWRQRAADARQGLSNARQQQEAAQQEVERIRQELNPMSLSYIGEDVNRILRLQFELTQALSRADTVNQQVAAAEKAYKDFEDEARRQGVPSSWLQ